MCSKRCEWARVTHRHSQVTNRHSQVTQVRHNHPRLTQVTRVTDRFMGNTHAPMGNLGNTGNTRGPAQVTQVIVYTEVCFESQDEAGNSASGQTAERRPAQFPGFPL